MQSLMVDALTGIKKGFWGKVTEVALHMKFMHWIPDRQATKARNGQSSGLTLLVVYRMSSVWFIL